MQPVSCWRCGLLMIDGTGAVLPGLCCPCGDEVDAERLAEKREERARLREHMAKPAQTAEELEAARCPFEQLIGEEE